MTVKVAKMSQSKRKDAFNLQQIVSCPSGRHGMTATSLVVVVKRCATGKSMSVQRMEVPIALMPTEPHCLRNKLCHATKIHAMRVWIASSLNGARGRIVIPLAESASRR